MTGIQRPYAGLARYSRKAYGKLEPAMNHDPTSNLVQINNQERDRREKEER